MKLVATEPAGASGDIHGGPTRLSGSTLASCALFLRHLTSEIKFFAEADIKYEQIDSPLSEKQVETVRLDGLADLPRILDSGMVPNAFSVLDLLVLSGWARADFDLAVPGSISVVVPFDDGDSASLTEVRLSSRVISPEGLTIQPFARTPWRPSSNDFAVEVITGTSVGS